MPEARRGRAADEGMVQSKKEGVEPTSRGPTLGQQKEAVEPARKLER